MAFTLRNWGRSSTSGNEPIVTLADASIIGAPRSYTYYTTDTQAVASAANYFDSVIYDLSVGDTITVYSATELSNVTYTVTSVTTHVTVAAVNGLLLASGTLTAAQWLGMYAAPVVLIAAPGANKLIIVESMSLSLVYGTVQFANGGAVQIQYDSTVNAGGVLAQTATIAAATINGATANNSIKLLGALAFNLNTAVANKGIYISNATGAFTAGDSTFRYSLLYRVVQAA